MSIEEELTTDNDISEIPPIHSTSTASAFYERKKQSKPIRVLTVLAYVLSVSLAGIFLSIYYIFVWDGQVTVDVAAKYQHAEVNPEALINYEFTRKGSLKSENLRNYDGGKFLSSIEEVSSSEQESFNDSSTIVSLNGTDEIFTVNGTNTFQNVTNDDFQIGLPHPTSDYEDATLFTTDFIPEENSTWSPELVDFNSDNADFTFDKRSIFLKKIFGDQREVLEE